VTEPRRDRDRKQIRKVTAGRFAELRERTFFFALFGLAFGVLLCGYATVLRVIGGTRAFDANGTSYTATLATYLVGPTLGGVVVSLLFPLTDSRLGAVLVGFIGAIPVYACAFLAVGGGDLAGVLICALGTGGGLGYISHADWYGD
jgi:hypothetical protein